MSCATDEGEYPIGAFVVIDRPSLGPLVTALRRMGRLKTGVNVTPLNVQAMRATESNPSVPDVDAHTSLRTAWVEVDESEEEAEPLSSSPPSSGAGVGRRWGITRHRLSLSDAHNTRSSTPSPVETFLASLAPKSSATTYMAVHATGHWSHAELRSFFALTEATGCDHTTEQGEVKTATTTSPPIAFIHQLRCYSRACWPVASLPPALTAMRGLARGGSTAKTPASSSFTFAELFGGIGMFRVGLERAGAKPLFAVEFAAPACAVYAANFDRERANPPHHHHKDEQTCEVPLAGDITEIPDAFFPAHDILTAGFPCQSFSKAGPAKGLQDAKGWLFHEVVRVVRATRPRAFLLENVENLMDVQEGDQLRIIRAWLQHPWTGAAGVRHQHNEAPVSYVVHQEVLDGAAVTPQKRRRVYFVGVRRDLFPNAPTATATSSCEQLATQWLNPIMAQARQHMATMREVSRGGLTQPSPWRRAEAQYGCVRDLLDPTLPPRRPLRTTTTTMTAHEQDAAGGLQGLRLSVSQWEAVRRSKKYRAHPDWRLADLNGNARTLMGSYRTSFQLYSEFVPLSEADATTPPPPDSDSTGRDSEEPDAPCRFYSVRECARLQGIPEHFTFLHETSDTAATETRRLPVGAAYKLVGNAVNPLVIECLGTALIETLHRLS